MECADAMGLLRIIERLLLPDDRRSPFLKTPGPDDLQGHSPQSKFSNFAELQYSSVIGIRRASPRACDAVKRCPVEERNAAVQLPLATVAPSEPNGS